MQPIWAYMDNLALLEMVGVVMEDGLAARKRFVLRGNRGGRLSRTDRLEDNYDETREKREAKIILGYEHRRIPEEFQPKDKVDFDSSGQNRKNSSSKTNYKSTSPKTAVRFPASEPDPLRSSAAASISSISDNSYEASRDNNSRIDYLPGKYGYRRQQQTREDRGGVNTKNIIVVSILIGLLVILFILFMNMIFLVFKPAVRFFKRKFRRLSSVNQSIIERRYKTIDKWLVLKTVQPHDDTCRNIQNYARLQNGESSLEIDTSATSHSNGSSPSTTFQSIKSYPPLCLTTSFGTRITHDYSSSNSTSSLSTSNRNGTDDFVSSCAFGSGDDIDNTIYIEEFKSTTTSNRNQLIDEAASSVEFEIEHDEIRGQLSNREMSTLPRIHTSSITDEDMAVESQSVLITREQVFEKMEITKPTKRIPKNTPYHQHSQVPQTFEKNEDERESGCSSYEEEDEKDPKQECIICMEGFKVGDIVSFSPAEGCHHIFHHNCLRQWLLRKSGCPCCRVIMLPIDRPEPKGCNEAGNDGVAPPTTVSRHHRRQNYSARQFLRLQRQHTQEPRNYKNTNAMLERLNKKCGTYCCVACGVVVLNTDLREDLCTKATPPARGNGGAISYY